MTRLALGLLVIFAACGGDDGTTGGHDAGIDSSGGGTQLVVKNVLNWCSVKVNGAATGSTLATITVPVTAGMIPITATAASATFKIDTNMWHHTDGDTGTGETGTVVGAQSSVMATVTAGTTKCVWVCCPFANDGHGCAVADQCP